MMLLAIYSIMWEQRALADRDWLCEAERARMASIVGSSAETRQPKVESRPDKSTLKRLVSAVEPVLGQNAI